MEGIELAPVEFVAFVNQTLEYAYPNVTIVGELSNFRVSKNSWVYFDLKDAEASVKFFGTVYQLPGPLENGMLVAVRGAPKLHPLYGFSVTIQAIRPVGEGTIKKAAELLRQKLTAEGLFDAARKRVLPYPPRHIALITSGESAAYRDFMKILSARWGGVDISLVDVQVQGEPAVGQIVRAIEQCNALPQPPDVLVLTRGGGSADDLQAFSTEQVTRAVAASRIPTLVAIGHEIDTSLAELAADQCASTPSNAAELLVPDRRAVNAQLENARDLLGQSLARKFEAEKARLELSRAELQKSAGGVFESAQASLMKTRQLLEAFNPQAALARGYALVRANGKLVRSGTNLSPAQTIDIQLQDAAISAKITNIKLT